MNKKQLAFGFIIGISVCVLGVFLFLFFFTGYDFLLGIYAIKSEGKLGKLITLGAILDLAVFWFLLIKKQEIIARGVVLSVILIAIATIFL